MLESFFRDRLELERVVSPSDEDGTPTYTPQIVADTFGKLDRPTISTTEVITDNKTSTITTYKATLFASADLEIYEEDSVWITPIGSRRKKWDVRGVHPAADGIGVHHLEVDVQRVENR